MSDPLDLAAAYWAHYRGSKSADPAVRKRADQLFWAWEEIEDRVASEPDTITQVLVVLADAAPDNAALAYLGAGPIENLLRTSNSPVMIDRVEGAARRNANFRTALRCAWFDDDVPPAVAERLRKFGQPY